MSNEEIAELKERLARLEGGAQPPNKPKGGCLVPAMIVGIIAVAAVFIFATDHGRQLAEREDVIGSACRSASATPSEMDACLLRMERDYRGPLTFDRAYNAAAVHVMAIREGD